MSKRLKNKPMENRYTRFWSKVEVKSDDECWRWHGATVPNGYGQIGNNGIVKYAHRISYELSKGPIPQGLHVCHSCDNKWCVNPAHLWAGTAKDNMQDAAIKGRLPKRNGDMAPNSKLTEEIVIALRNGAVSTKEVAHKFGVTRSAANSAKSGKSWRYIDCATRAAPV